MNEEELFKAALQLESPDAQEQYLLKACREDTDMLDRVRLLLRISNDQDSFLENAAFDTSETASIIENEFPVGAKIGPYKLLQVIGEGGFGLVFMAEQTSPMRRKVALKVIKPGMDSRDVTARFEAERQALALMDHPNIAQVFDGGTTSTGRPYFVMELVRGVSITDYADQANLTTQERLHLFVAVCRAIQHAHQKGVIHRDIKPSNVLVTLHDGVPNPKVIDFGVAKAISQNLTDKTMFTRYGQVIGTPQYMSPEQAEMSGLEVDTRTDIYSLGVLAYELLTGHTPLAVPEQADGIDELRRRIREEEPRTPSQFVQTLDNREASTVATRRAVTPHALTEQLKNDLDWIIMRTLRKNRELRYDTAAALGDDIQRHLNEEPVLAGPPTLGYQLTKFWRRRRSVVVGVAGVAIACLFMLGTVVVALLHTSRALAAESLARQDAVSAAENTRRLLELSFEILAKIGTDPDTGREYTVRDALAILGDRLIENTNLAPATEAEFHLGLGRAFLIGGDRARSAEHFQKAFDIGRRVWTDDSDTRLSTARRHAAYLADGLDPLADAVQSDRGGGNVTNLVKSLALYGEFAARTGNDAVAEPALAEAVEKFPVKDLQSFQVYEFPHLILADLRQQRGNLEAANSVRASGIRLMKQRFGDSDANWFRIAMQLESAHLSGASQRAFDVGLSCENKVSTSWFRVIGLGYRKEGAFAEADIAFRFAVQHAKSRNAVDELIWSQANLGRLRKHAGDLHGAEPFLRTAAELSENGLVASSFAYHEYARLLTDLGRPSDATTYYHKTMEELQNNSSPDENHDATIRLSCQLATEDKESIREAVTAFVKNEGVIGAYRGYILARALDVYDDLDVDPEVAIALLETSINEHGYPFAEYPTSMKAYLKLMDQLDRTDLAIQYLVWVKWVFSDLRLDRTDTSRAWIRQIIAEAMIENGSYAAAKRQIQEAKEIFECNLLTPEGVFNELDRMLSECEKHL